MEIKNLRYFLAVAREENMSHAAEMLHVTQPTLSKALKALEDELGKKLFIRHSFSIKLTDEGMLLRDRAEDLVAMADKIELSPTIPKGWNVIMKYNSFTS
jgi:DNA-binding transcriptional LysR family regulator